MTTTHPYINLLQTIWKFAHGMRKKLVLIWVMFTFANVAEMLKPLFLGLFLNTIQKGGDGVVASSAWILGIYCVSQFGFFAFHGPARVIERSVSFNIYRNYSKHMFNIVTSLPLKWHKDNHSGKTIDKINRAGYALKDFTDESYIYIESIVPFIISIIAIFIIIKWQGMFLFLISLVVLLVITKFDKFLTGTLKEINKKGHSVAAVFYDYVSNISTIITLRFESLAKNEYIRRMTETYPVFMKNVKVNEIKWFSVSMILMFSFFAMMMFYINKTYNSGSPLLVGTLVMLYGYMFEFTNVFYGVAWKYEKLVMTSTTMLTIESILEDYDKLCTDHKIKHINNTWREIELKNLYFKYEDERHHLHTLDNVNLKLKKGLKIALVGESGSGKSTLMTLLRGLNMANSVEILVDGKKYNDLRALGNVTTLIPQDPEIFENTIEYNITMGVPYDKKDFVLAVKMACFDKVLKKLPKGILTDIREKGVNLSGGEKQRLALARGLFAAKNSSVVLLDEPTSSVDSTNEVNIHKMLFENFKNKCIVSSIHRLNLLNMFDYIYVFEKGKLIEEGSFDHLVLKKDGHLKKQLKNYSDKNK